MTNMTGWQPEQEAAEEAATSAADPYEEFSTFEIIRAFIAEGKSYASNEMERQKLRATVLGRAARDAFILGIIALILLMGSLIAGLIGLIMALASVVGGPLAATAIVVGGTLVIILILLLWARARIRKAIAQSFAHQEEADV